MRLSIASAVAMIIAGTAVAQNSQATATNVPTKGVGAGVGQGVRPQLKAPTSIPAQELGSALQSLASDRQLYLIYAQDDVLNHRTSGAAGELTADETLNQLLKDTGLTYRYLDDKTITIVPIASAPASDKKSLTSLEKTSWNGSNKSLRLAQSEGSTNSSADKDDSSGVKLEEIVVTAQKREERLRDVPFGISALSNRDLERTGAKGAEDYLSLVPGAHYTPLGRGKGTIVIRGVSTEGSNLNNLQRTVEVYVDELPMLDRFGGWTQPDLNTFDIERVEVLRGPQGTLFGAGALGGAVRLITAKPVLSEFQAKIEAGLAFTRGGDESKTLNAMVNLPLVEGQLALRLAGYHRDDGGYVDNVFRSEENVDSGGGDGVRAILAYEPTDRLAVRFTALYEKNTADDSSRTFASSAAGEPDEWLGVLPERYREELNIYNLTVDYDAGPVAVTSTTTYGIRDSFTATDFLRFFVPEPQLDASPADFWLTRDSKRFAQEVRLASQAEGPLEWTVGTFFLNYRGITHQLWDLDDSDPAALLRDRTAVRSIETALFGEATYSFTDALKFTAGLRWVDSTFKLETVSTGAGDSSVPLTKARSDSVTPKVSLSYYPAPDVHLYATASKGYRVGQVNFSQADPRIPLSFKPDSLWNYELGMKSTWFDNRLSANVAIFYIDWSNIQLQRILPGTAFNFTDNAGEATIKGAEAEFVFRPSRHFEVGSSLSYNDAELESVLTNVPYIPGSRLPGSAKYSASSYAQVTSDFSDDLSAYLRVSHRYVGPVYSDINNSSAVASDRYHAFDVRAGVQRGPYEFVAYVTNVFDNDAATSRQTLAYVVPYAYQLRPRTIGVTIRSAF